MGIVAARRTQEIARAQTARRSVVEASPKGYRLTCGTYVRESDGKRLPKVFWLGHDLRKAQQMVLQIRMYASIAAAMRGWTKAFERHALEADPVAKTIRNYVISDVVSDGLRIGPPPGASATVYSALFGGTSVPIPPQAAIAKASGIGRVIACATENVMQQGDGGIGRSRSGAQRWRMR